MVMAGQKIYDSFYAILNHITNMYIQSLRTYFENCLCPRFVSQGSFSQPSSQWPAQAALRHKSWRETIFKLIAGSKYQCIYM